MSCSILPVGRIPTRDANKKENGCLLTLVNIHDPGTLPIEQVYITICEAGDVKGPHMHAPPKHDRFYCIEGKAALVCRDESTGVIQEFTLQAFDRQVLLIPPLHSHAIVALEGRRAVVLSMPNEGYNPHEPYNQTETCYDEYDWSKWL